MNPRASAGVVLTARKVNSEMGVALGGGQYHFVATWVIKYFPGEHLLTLAGAMCSVPFTLPAKSEQN
jgi:hypothetical protein